MLEIRGALGKLVRDKGRPTILQLTVLLCKVGIINMCQKLTLLVLTTHLTYGTKNEGSSEDLQSSQRRQDKVVTKY